MAMSEVLDDTDDLKLINPSQGDGKKNTTYFETELILESYEEQVVGVSEDVKGIEGKCKAVEDFVMMNLDRNRNR